MAYKAVKKGNPDAKILAPSGTGHFFPFLEKLMELGGGDSFDILSIHTYAEPFPPEIGYQFNGEKDYAYRVQRSRSILKQYGAEKPVWNTEVGYGPAPTIAGRQMNSQDIVDEATPELWPNWSPGWSWRPTDGRRVAAFIARFYLISESLGVQKTFFHHRFMERPDTNPYIAAPAIGWLSQLLNGAKFDREYDWGKQIKSLGFKLADGRYMDALWRVENESLSMRDKKDAQLGTVESAPLVGAEQKGITQTSSTISAGGSYFPEGRKVPTSLTLPSPVAGFDFWGNPLPESAKWDILEAPSYLIFASAPSQPPVSVNLGTPPMEPSAHEAFTETGKWESNITERKASPESIPAFYPSATPISFAHATAEDGGKVLSAGEASIGTITLVTSRLPREEGRLLIQVRSNDKLSPNYSFGYSIVQDGKPQAMHPWPIFAPAEIMKGQGWSVMRGTMISEPFVPSEEITIRCDRGSGRLYTAWWIPSQP